MAMAKATQKRALKDPCKCPFCESDDIESKPLFDGDTPAHQNFRVECGGCGETWIEVYKLVAVFQEDDDG